MVRDARGTALRWTRPVFEEEWQNDVALASAGSAHALLSEGRTPDKAVELARSAMAGASKLIDGFLALAPERAPACRAGCAHCCHQAVGVSAPEVLAIHDHLRSTRAPAELASLAARIRDADDRTRGMTAAERLSPELACPFLEREQCSIYEARPLACRGKYSLDAEACARTLRDAEARAAYLAGTLLVPSYLEPLRAFHAVTAGMELSLHELHGLRMSPLELTAAMRVLLDEPETVTRRWLAGEDPFEAARGGDGTDDPRLRALSGGLT